MTFHPAGTSKMGPHTDHKAVLDYRLRVKGIEHLRQIDAGIFPIIPSANINVAVIMAENGSDVILVAFQLIVVWQLLFTDEFIIVSCHYNNNN